MLFDCGLLLESRRGHYTGTARLVPSRALRLDVGRESWLSRSFALPDLLRSMSCINDLRRLLQRAVARRPTKKMRKPKHRNFKTCVGLVSADRLAQQHCGWQRISLSGDQKF